MAKIGVLTIPGMGRQGPDFDRILREAFFLRFDQETVTAWSFRISSKATRTGSGPR